MPTTIVYSPIALAVTDSHARKPGAIIEGTFADARHTIRDCYVRKPFATLEGRPTYARHAVGDCHARKSGATTEGRIGNAQCSFF